MEAYGRKLREGGVWRKDPARALDAGLYLRIADVAVQCHSGHATRGCIPRGGAKSLRSSYTGMYPQKGGAPDADTHIPNRRLVEGIAFMVYGLGFKIEG